MTSLTMTALITGATLLSITGCSHKIIRPDTQPVESNMSQSSLTPTHFALNSAVLTDVGKAALREDAQALKDDPKIKIQAQGFCDDRGSVKYNLALGERRAVAVKAYLETLGISGDRIATMSFGKADPLDPRNNEQAWALNRRASFVIQTGQKEVAYR